MRNPFSRKDLYGHRDSSLGRNDSSSTHTCFIAEVQPCGLSGQGCNLQLGNGSDPNAPEQSGAGKMVVRPVFFAVILLLLAGGFAILRYAQDQSEPVSQPLAVSPATESSEEPKPLATSSTGADPASAGAGTLKIFVPRMPDSGTLHAKSRPRGLAGLRR